MFLILQGLADGAPACLPEYLLSLTSWPFPADNLLVNAYPVPSVKPATHFSTW